MAEESVHLPQLSRPLHRVHPSEVERTDVSILEVAINCAEDLFFQRIGKKRDGNGSYHRLEFRLRVLALGIPCTKDGREKGVVPDGPFDKFLERHEIPRAHEYDKKEDSTPARLPKRISWRCACEDGVPFPVPRGSVVRVRCEDCNQRYQPPTLSQSMVPGRKTDRIVRK